MYAKPNIDIQTIHQALLSGPDVLLLIGILFIRLLVGVSVRVVALHWGIISPHLLRQSTHLRIAVRAFSLVLESIRVCGCQVHILGQFVNILRGSNWAEF